MGLKMGTIISQKRKAKQITQQQLADFVGVSKASVSKWETGQTYPDITLLPLLASYFDVTVDELLNYSNDLSKEQVQKIYSDLRNKSETATPEETLKMIEDIIHRYYSSALTILEMGSFLINHGDILPGKDKAEKTQLYLTKAQKLFQHVLEISTDPVLLDKATNNSAYCSLVLNRPDEVLDALGEYVPEYYPTESLIAWSYQLKGETDRAIATTQSALYQYVAVMMSQLTNYLQLLPGQPDKFQETYRRGQTMINIFHVQELNPVLVINFTISAAMGFVQEQKTDAVMKCLSEFIDVLDKLKFPLQQHGDKYFDQIDDWLNQTDLGHELPRDEQQLKTDFVDLIPNNPNFMAYQDDARFQKILQRLQTIKERLER